MEDLQIITEQPRVPGTNGYAAAVVTGVFWFAGFFSTLFLFMFCSNLLPCAEKCMVVYFLYG